jgi:hypothetical protein
MRSLADWSASYFCTRKKQQQWNKTVPQTAATTSETSASAYTAASCLTMLLLRLAAVAPAGQPISPMLLCWQVELGAHWLHATAA